LQDQFKQWLALHVAEHQLVLFHRGEYRVLGGGVELGVGLAVLLLAVSVQRFQAGAVALGWRELVLRALLGRAAMVGAEPVIGHAVAEGAVQLAVNKGDAARFLAADTEFIGGYQAVGHGAQGFGFGSGKEQQAGGARRHGRVGSARFPVGGGITCGASGRFGVGIGGAQQWHAGAGSGRRHGNQYVSTLHNRCSRCGQRRDIRPA
jgi:hypothetical protein